MEKVNTQNIDQPIEKTRKSKKNKILKILLIVVVLLILLFLLRRPLGSVFPGMKQLPILGTESTSEKTTVSEYLKDLVTGEEQEYSPVINVGGDVVYSENVTENQLPETGFDYPEGVEVPGRFVGTSEEKTNGLFQYSITVGDETTEYIGYEAANKLCAQEYVGSHMCSTDEIVSTIASKGASYFADIEGENYVGVDAWVSEGAPGYTSNSNDCNGWKSNAGESFYGAFWIFSDDGGGNGWLTNCASTKKIACCQEPEEYNIVNEDQSNE